MVNIKVFIIADYHHCKFSLISLSVLYNLLIKQTVASSIRTMLYRKSIDCYIY